MRSTRLRIGQRIVVYPRKINQSTSVKSKEVAQKKPLPTGEFTSYTVKSGDSLWLIAQKYSNVSVENIKEWNNIWSVKSLKPGTKLKIYNK